MKYFLFLLWASPLFLAAQSDPQALQGAWSTTFAGSDGETNELSMIIADGYFVMTAYNAATKTFIATLGGSYTADGKTFDVTYEFDSSNPDKVGNESPMAYQIDGSLLVFNNDKVWQRVDEGTGPLAGAWQITGRKDQGEMKRRAPSGPRRTMKILSGQRFQWIAYNTETAEFLGTGGGSYTSDDDLYIERIEFFSRDPGRVGSQLSFDYKIRNNEWHHSGLSSKGEPIYETWGHRE